jgi:hypothetical protein
LEIRDPPVFHLLLDGQNPRITFSLAIENEIFIFKHHTNVVVNGD